jgi:hypothetical protein
MPSYFFLPEPHISFLEVGRKEGNAMICLGEEAYTTERFESAI